MKNKWIISVVFALFLTLIGISGTQIQAEEESGRDNEKVELTEAQKKEMAILYQDLMDKRKGIINKYLEYGVIDEEDAKKMTEHMDAHYKKMEESGFQMHWGKHKNRHMEKPPVKFPH
ncbi:YckD family protein [Sediminibacillus massiliensis]|uniref:YckD family protein n=1 Tax=Sediminibacillus massiliensis TaxID=1926277 RepID=UPI00098867EA|nr:YckD family protein [Sediminibacillus massiliensis]